MADRVRRRPDGRWRGSGSRLAAAALAVGVLTGCAAVPTASRVQRVARLPAVGALPGQGVRVLAPPPPRGGDLYNFVSDFLLATGDPQGDFAAARAYLSPAEARRWNPDRQTQVFDGVPILTPDAPPGDRRPVAVTVGLTETARLSGSGDYTPMGGAQLTLHMSAEWSQGRWRLTEVPPGVVVSDTSFALSFHPLDLYFFDPTGSQLVPDRVFLPGPRAQLAQTVVRALLRGPSARLAGAVADPLPTGVRLVSVTTGTGGALDVALAGVPTTLSGSRRMAVDQELVWTLSQLVPEGRLVLVTADGAPLLPGNPVHSVADYAYARVGPDVVPPGYAGYYVAVARSRLLLARVGGPAFDWLGVAGRRRVPLRHPAVALPGASPPGTTEVAGLGCTAADVCRQVFVGAVTPGGANRLSLRQATGRGSFATPSWGRLQNAFWVVRSGDGPPQGFLVGAVGPARPVALGLPAGVRSVPVWRVSRDGTRVAMVAEGDGGVQVLVGRLTGGVHPRVGALVSVGGAMGSVADLSWAAADQLLVLGQLSGSAAAGIEPYVLPVDGSTAPTPVIGTGITVVPDAAASGPDLAQSAMLAGGGRVFLLTQPTWHDLGAGEDPTYSG